MDHEEEFDESMETLDAFIEYLKEQMEDGTYTSITDPAKVEIMKFCALAIKRALPKTGCPVKITSGQESVLGSRYGWVRIEADKLDITDTKWFCRAAEFADSTECYPLANGKVRMTFTFHRVTIPIDQST